MGKYRKKPVEVEAFRTRDIIAAAKENWKELPTCIPEAYERGDIVFLPGAVFINTLEGSHKANIDDWVIQGVKGELYPCKSDIFEATYEHVAEPMGEISAVIEPKNEHVLTEDDCGHWYVIPHVLQEEFEEYVEHTNLNEDDWTGFDFERCRINGSPNRVVFTEYRTE